MSGKIFKEIKDAILTRTPDFLLYCDVGQEDFDQVLKSLRHRTNYLENHSFRISWSSYDRILKVVMPSKIHECPAAWLFEMVTTAGIAGILPEIWSRTMWIAPSPEYDNFTGDYEGSLKEADLTFVPLVGPEWVTKAEYPSVVLESGWSESGAALHRDARLWQVGSEKAVHVVLLVKFFRENPTRVRLSIYRTSANGTTISPKHYQIFPVPDDAQENPYISLEEFYAGNCPPDVDPTSRVRLDLARLRVMARSEITARGNQPA